MNPYKILLVEDDPVQRMQVSDILEDFGYVVYDGMNKIDDIKSLTEPQPNLAILDINLGARSKMNGIELGSAIKKIVDIPIIFLTVSGDRPTIDKAKAINPSGYLVKPVSQGQLDAAIDISLHNFYSTTVQEGDGNESRIFSNYPVDKEWFSFKEGSKYVRLRYNDVTHIEADRDVTYIYLKTGERLIHGCHLKETMEQMRYDNYMQVHRSYWVNRDHVKSFDNSVIELTSARPDTLVPIGKTFKDEFMASMNTLRT